MRALVEELHSWEGINYGIGQLGVDDIQSDLNFLRQFFASVRPTYPSYASTSVPYWQMICECARRLGFDVMWGITCPQALSADFDNFLNAFVELAPWAVEHGITLGVNEEAYHNNKAVLPNEAVFSGLAAASRAIKVSYPKAQLVVSLAGDGELDSFIAHGDLGGFDFVGLNQYDTLAKFKANLNKLVSIYGDRALLTEFNTGRGFDPDYGTEATWKADIKARMDYAKAVGLKRSYAYTAEHNAEKTASGAFKWNFRTSRNSNSWHRAFDLFN